MMLTAILPSHAFHWLPPRNASGPMPRAPVLCTQAGRIAVGNRTVSVIGMVVGLPA